MHGKTYYAIQQKLFMNGVGSLVGTPGYYDIMHACVTTSLCCCPHVMHR